MSDYYVYILASKRNGTLYTGSTGNLQKRIYEHKNGFIEVFTKKYDVHLLVYYEVFQEERDALYREKQIKEWKRKWKLELIEGFNPEWKDLFAEIIQ